MQNPTKGAQILLVESQEIKQEWDATIAKRGLSGFKRVWHLGTVLSVPLGVRTACMGRQPKANNMVPLTNARLDLALRIKMQSNPWTMQSRMPLTASAQCAARRHHGESE